MMNVKYVNEEQIVKDLMLVSTANGMDTYQLMVNHVAERIKQIADTPNFQLKKIIAGYHRGYTAYAVADFLIKDLTTWGFSELGISGEQQELLIRCYDTFMDKEGYGPSWGGSYGYTPSIEETQLDPLDVQVEINQRAEEAAKLAHIETIRFGEYRQNASVINSRDELDALKQFRSDVVIALNSRYAKFFGTHAE